MKKSLCFLCAVLAVLFQTAFSSTDVEKKKLTIESECEWRVSNEIRKYYPSMKYLISADATVLEEYPAEDTEKPTRDLMLPGVKGFETNVEKENVRISVEKIEVQLLADKYFTKSDPELLRLLENIVYYSGKLSRSRGDKVTITEMSFPSSTPVPPVNVDSVTQAHKELTRSKLPAVDTTNENNSGMGADLSLMNIKYIGALFLVGGIAIGVLLLVRRSKLDEVRYQQKVTELDNERQQNEIKNAEPNVMLMLPENIQRANQKAELEKKKSEIITTAVGRPDVIIEVIREMLRDPQKQAQAQTVLSSLGQSIIAIVREHVTETENHQLSKLIADAPQVENEMVNTALASFQNAIVMQKFTMANNEKRNPFAFLEKLSEPQLYLLMKDEPAGIVAMILSQVNPGIAGSLLRNLPSMQQGEVSMELVKLQRLTSDAYLSVARDLATKASKIPAINNVQVQGPELLMDIFDNMDESNEHSIFEYIKVMNVDLYREISSQRVAFTSIDSFDDKIIRQIMKDVPGEEMALALKNAPEKIIEKFLSVLPSKAKTILNEHIANLDSVSLEEEQKVRRKITRLVRNYLRVAKKA